MSMLNIISKLDVMQSLDYTVLGKLIHSHWNRKTKWWDKTKQYISIQEWILQRYYIYCICTKSFIRCWAKLPASFEIIILAWSLGVFIAPIDLAWKILLLKWNYFAHRACPWLLFTGNMSSYPIFTTLTNFHWSEFKIRQVDCDLGRVTLIPFCYAFSFASLSLNLKINEVTQKRKEK